MFRDIVEAGANNENFLPAPQIHLTVTKELIRLYVDPQPAKQHDGITVCKKLCRTVISAAHTNIWEKPYSSCLFHLNIVC